MSSIHVYRISITDLDTDAIVNAANSGLRAGGGVCGAIFREAGYDRLTAECSAYGHCDTGSAVITSGLRLRAKYIIHAVGPIYQDGHHNERELLYSAYQSALKLAVQYDCRSIGFPLISAGIYGYPADEAWAAAMEACSDFIRSHPETDIRIIFAVLNDDMLAKGKAALQKVQ